jgi:flagellar biosynthesis component FlhA
MPNYNPKPGRKFQKGQVANPLGAGAHNPVVKAAKKLTAETVARMIEVIANHPSDEMDSLKSMKLSFLEEFLLTGLIQARKKGDLDTLLKVLERVVGKVKEQVDHSGETTTRVIIENYISKGGNDERGN